MSLDFILQLFATQFGYWWIIWLGILLGIVVGILPGFSPQNTLIMLLPLTVKAPPEQAMAFMVALYCANHLAGGVPAILMKIPGSGGAAATTLDGYPMTQKGQGQQAIVLSFTASVFGGLITSIATLALLPWLSQLGLYLRSVEMVVVMLFGLTLIAVIAAKDTLKGLIAGLFGLLIGVIGTDHIYNTPRATFGFLELYDGVPLAPALIGLFAISEALVMIEEKLIVTKAGQKSAMASNWAATIDGLRMTVQKWWHIVWTSFVGLFIGLVPGAGASIAAFVAYQQSRMWSKTPELYGTGIPEGVIAPEAANNGVTSGTLVPMMALGVPGGSTAAVMMIVLQYQGMVMGPRLFSSNPGLAYGVFVSMVVAYIFMILTIPPMARYMSRIVLFPTSYLAPIIILVTCVAAFAERQYLFDMGLALGFGVIGYIAHKTGYHVTALLIGVILGPLFEQYVVRSLRLSQGDPSILFSSTIGNVLWATLVLSLILPPLRRAYQRKSEPMNDIKATDLLARNVKRLGRLDIPGGGQVRVHGNFAFVGHMNPPHGTTIADISDPTNPRVLTTLMLEDSKSHTHKVRVAGDIMITNVEMNKRHVLRRGAQKLPVAEAKLRESLGRAPDDAEIAAEIGGKEQDVGLIRAFMKNGYPDGGFKVWDISDRARPRLLHHQRTFGFGVHRFDMDENYAYISTEMEGYVGNILVIYDLKRPEKPEEVARWWMPGQHLAGGEKPTWSGYKNRLHHGLRVGNRMWAACWHAGLRVIDVSDIRKPTTIGAYDYHPPFPEPTHTVLHPPFKVGGKDVAVVFDEEHDHVPGRMHAGMWVFDVSDVANMKPLSIFQVSELDSPWSRVGRFGAHQPTEHMSDTLVYASWFSGGLRIVDIADPSLPREVGHYIPEPASGQSSPQSNDVDTDDRGLIYLLDRNVGLDILEYRPHA